MLAERAGERRAVRHHVDADDPVGSSETSTFCALVERVMTLAAYNKLKTCAKKII